MPRKPAFLRVTKSVLPGQAKNGPSEGCCGGRSAGFEGRGSDAAPLGRFIIDSGFRSGRHRDSGLVHLGRWVEPDAPARLRSFIGRRVDHFGAALPAPTKPRQRNFLEQSQQLPIPRKPANSIGFRTGATGVDPWIYTSRDRDPMKCVWLVHDDVPDAGRVAERHPFAGVCEDSRVPFVPDGFEPPTGLLSERFVLEPLGREHNEGDFEAWSSSIAHIRATPGYEGRAWPHEMTLEENRGDLERHAADFAARAGFTYTVLDPASREVIGCVYIYPAEDGRCDAAVRSWVRASRAELDRPLRETVWRWLAEAWPFECVAYAAQKRRKSEV